MRGESASAAMAAAAEWPRELLDALPASVVIVEPGSARVLFANRAALALTGDAGPVGRSAAEWMPSGSCRDAEGRPLADEALPSLRAARGERVRGTMVTCETPRGERTLRATAQPITAPDGSEALLMSFEDVTELRAAQLGERLVADDLRAILEGIADSVTAQGPDGSLVYANEAAVRVLGFPSAEALLSAPLAQIMARWILLTPEGEPQSLAELPGRLALMGQEPEGVLVQFIDRESGERRWSRIKAKPVRDADGSVRLAINVIEDVTGLKQVEQSQRFLAEASRVLTDSLEYESPSPRSRSSRCRRRRLVRRRPRRQRRRRARPRRRRARRPGEGDMGPRDRGALPRGPARRPRRPPRAAHGRVPALARHPGRADRRLSAG